MAEPVRHRRTKGAATDTFSLQQPRHTSTLPIVLKKSGTEGPSAIFESEGPVQHRFIAIARAITNHSFVRSSASDFFNTIDPSQPFPSSAPSSIRMALADRGGLCCHLD